MEVTEDFCGVIFEIVYPRNFLTWIYSVRSSSRCAGRLLLSTMSDGSHGILIEIFLIAAQNLSVELF